MINDLTIKNKLLHDRIKTLELTQSLAHQITVECNVQNACHPSEMEEVEIKVNECLYSKSEPLKNIETLTQIKRTNDSLKFNNYCQINETIKEPSQTNTKIEFLEKQLDNFKMKLKMSEKQRKKQKLVTKDSLNDLQYSKIRKSKDKWKNKQKTLENELIGEALV